MPFIGPGDARIQADIGQRRRDRDTRRSPPVPAAPLAPLTCQTRAAAASGPRAFGNAQWFAGSWLGVLVLFGMSGAALQRSAHAWSIATGIFRIVLAFRSGSWLIGLWGALGVAIGLWMVAAPGAGLLALIWVVAIQAVVGGVLLVSLAFRLRRVHHDPSPG